MNRSTPGLPVHHQLPDLTQTHVHQVGDAIQPLIIFKPCSSVLLSMVTCCTLYSRLLCPWNFPGEKSGMGTYFLTGILCLLSPFTHFTHLPLPTSDHHLRVCSLYPGAWKPMGSLLSKKLSLAKTWSNQRHHTLKF